MSEAALDDYLEGARRQAAMSFALDEALGTHHGISSSDFVLLQSLHEAVAPMAEADLARRLGALRSHLLMRVRPLEKLGWLVRTPDARNCRSLSLSPKGRRLVSEARETAAAVCQRWAAGQ